MSKVGTCAARVSESRQVRKEAAVRSKPGGAAAILAGAGNPDTAGGVTIDGGCAATHVQAGPVTYQALYRKYGFTTVSTRRGYYSDNNESALVMWAGNLKSEIYGNRLRALRAALLN